MNRPRWLHKPRHGATPPPTHPVYADQRTAGVTLSARSKIFVVLTIVVAALLVGGYFAIQQTLAENHNERVKDEKAGFCLVIRYLPNTGDPANPVDALRAQYHCPLLPRPPAPSKTITITPAPRTVTAEPSKSTPVDRSSPVADAPPSGAEPGESLSAPPADATSPTDATTWPTSVTPAPQVAPRAVHSTPAAVARSTPAAQRTPPATKPSPSPTPAPSSTTPLLCTLAPILCGLLAP